MRKKRFSNPQVKTFSESERQAYLLRLGNMERTHNALFERQKDFQDKDERTRDLGRTLQQKQSEVANLERALAQLEAEYQQKVRVVEGARAMVLKKRGAMGHDVGGCEAMVRVTMIHPEQEARADVN